MGSAEFVFKLTFHWKHGVGLCSYLMPSQATTSGERLPEVEVRLYFRRSRFPRREPRSANFQVIQVWRVCTQGNDLLTGDWWHFWLVGAVCLCWPWLGSQVLCVWKVWKAGGLYRFFRFFFIFEELTGSSLIRTPQKVRRNLYNLML